MPWEVRPRGSEYCVHRSDTGKLVKCHPTKAQADAHMRALYANEDSTMGFEIERGFLVDLFGQDRAVAQTALAGDPILIMPHGTYYRDGQARTIDASVVEQFVDNWVHRTERGIRRSHLAVDVDHDGQARGWYSDVVPLVDGLGASFNWTPAGRKLLEEDAYAYFSASVYWTLVDRVTNEPVHNQLGGGALTNYPFFGEESALFGLQVGPEHSPIWYAITKTEDGVQYPARAYLVVEDPQRPSTWHLRVRSWQGGKLENDHQLMGAVGTTLTSPGGQYQGPQKAEATMVLRRLYEQAGLDFSITGGSIMGDNQIIIPQGTQSADQALGILGQLFSRLGIGGQSDPPATPPPAASDPPAAGTDAAALEGFVELQSQVAELVTQVGNLSGTLTEVTEQRDEYHTQVETLQASLGVMQEAGALQRFQAMAEGFGHLPPTPDDLAGHLRWLYTADTEDEQPHAVFFAELLGRADEEFARAFSERGVSHGAAADAMGQIDVAVKEYITGHPGTEYTVALDAVLATRPDLYALYEEQRGGGTVQ